MIRIAPITVVGLVAISACDVDRPPTEPRTTLDQELRQTIGQWGVVPIGKMPPQNAARVELGRALFFDKVLSGNRDVSCAMCHQPEEALTDRLSLAVGTGGTGVGAARTLGEGRQFGPRHSPSLLNSGIGLSYIFWDGRLARHSPGAIVAHGDTVFLPNVASNPLRAQAMLPVLNRQEMRGFPGDTDVFGSPNELATFDDHQHPEIWNAVMDRLTAIPEYVDLFAAAFPDTPPQWLQFEDAAEALATFQRSAFTHVDTPFDRFLRRDGAAMTVQQKRGALLFFGEGRCSQCHNGPFLGGEGFANVGAPQVGPGFGRQLPLDMGRFEIDEFEHYQFAFRVPPLRNVELTAPYMHSGAYPTLQAVLRHYKDIERAMRTYDVTQLAPVLRDSYHGDPGTLSAIATRLDGRLQQPFDFTDSEMQELEAFLRALTDPAARDLSHVAPSRVPSGLPVQD
jgi:cytochrome c peroxidase